MAFRILRLCGGSANFLKNYTPPSNALECSPANAFNILRTHVPLLSINRNVNFFNKLPAEALWKGVTSVSNAGKRRGRAKTLVRKKDLNKGQYMGCGKANIMFPGLNAPTIKGSVVLQQSTLNGSAIKKMEPVDTRPVGPGTKTRRQHPLERGWTSAKAGGRTIGPPSSQIYEEKFEGFQTWILESKFVANMTGNLGRKSRSAVFVVTGNGNGSAGFGLGKSLEQRQAANLAKNKAGRRLMYIKRHDEHTVLHDFYSQFGTTKVFAKKMHKGYGLIGHRVLRACCQAIGIKDIHIKTEGSRNTQNLTKAFFIGLLQQKTYQEIADDTKLHLVELREEKGNYPTIMASPAKTLNSEEVKHSTHMDFSQYIMGGRVVLQKSRTAPFYTKLKSWDVCRRKIERVRGHEKTKLRLMAEYGHVRSFLAEQYPEAHSGYVIKKDEE